MEGWSAHLLTSTRPVHMPSNHNKTSYSENCQPGGLKVIIHAIKIVAHLVFLHLKPNKSYIFYLSNFRRKMHIKQVGELYQHKLYNYDQMVLSISLLSFFSSLSSLLPLFRVCPGAAGAAQGRSLKTLHKYELKASEGYQFIPVESIKILSTEFLCRVKSKSLKVCRKDI